MVQPGQVDRVRPPAVSTSAAQPARKWASVRPAGLRCGDFGRARRGGAFASAGSNACRNPSALDGIVRSERKLRIG